MKTIFQTYCEKFHYYPEIEVEIETFSEVKDEVELTYHYYLGELVAIESRKASKYRLFYTEKGRKLFNRLALLTLKQSINENRS